MSDLLDHAINAVKRLPEERQTVVAQAMLAFAANEDAPSFDFDLPGNTPTEEEITALMPTVMPSAVPTKAEVAAWNRLSGEEQLRRMREALNHPDCNTMCPDSMDDILAEAHRLADARRG
jgi:hypothetical protein